MDKIGYAVGQTDNIVFICANISEEQLNSLKEITDIFVSDLGSNGYLIEFERDDKADLLISELTRMNDGPLKDFPVMPSPVQGVHF